MPIGTWTKPLAEANDLYFDSIMCHIIQKPNNIFIINPNSGYLKKVLVSKILIAIRRHALLRFFSAGFKQNTITKASLSVVTAGLCTCLSEDLGIFRAIIVKYVLYIETTKVEILKDRGVSFKISNKYIFFI